MHVLNTFEIITLNDPYRLFLNERYLIKKHDFYIDINIDKITKKLHEELNNFKRIFNYYFEIFVFPFYDNFKGKINKTLFSPIDKHFTFNYTPTFDKVFSNKSITSHLHGKIDSTSNKIVLGINEIPNGELDKKHFLPFTKYFQKLDNSTDYNFLKDFEKDYSSNYIFFFWGHSLDISDKDYIDDVFEFTKNSSSDRKIIVIYHNEISKSQLLINLFNIRGKDDIIKLTKDKKLIFCHQTSSELNAELKKDISNYTPSVSVF